MVSGVLTCGSNFKASGNEIAAPSTPASSTGVVYFDSINHVLSEKANNSATVRHTVQTSSCSGSTPVVANINADGSITCGAASMVVASGTASLGTTAVGSGACSSAITVSATGVATTDVITATANADPTGVTGYTPATTGTLYVWAYPTTNNVNFKLCNNTSASITPGSAVTLNWRVSR